VGHTGMIGCIGKGVEVVMDNFKVSN
jgi:hypothetical protein